MTGCHQQKPKIGLTKCPDLVDHDMPLLKVVVHRALTEIRERLEWAADYLTKNACRTKQRKSIHNRALETM